ncbi:MAG: class C beta-lactamase [Rhizomicrobium sp.]
MISKAAGFLAAIILVVCASTSSHAADDSAKVKAIVDAAVRPMMEKHDIPGMAVGVTTGGNTYTFEYGVVSKETRKPVTPATMFELGSISKTFTVTLASLAEVNGQLSLSDKTSKYLPSMQGKPFGDVSLMNLGTHTAGGFPLQLPDAVKTSDELMNYFENWKPIYKAGTARTYANPSIGMLGVITARAINKDFAAAMEGQIFPGLGLTNTYIHVPSAKMADYAQGYTRTDKPARMTEAILATEAYGVKSTATDMIRVVRANMNMIKLDAKLQQAITNTHIGYFKDGAMTQDLIWEQYDDTADLETLLKGNSNDMIQQTPVMALTPPLKPRTDAWINKTGSTNGFGAYVAFVPEKKIGIVIFANKNYPNEDHVRIAYEVFTRLGLK